MAGAPWQPAARSPVRAPLPLAASGVWVVPQLLLVSLSEPLGLAPGFTRWVISGQRVSEELKISSFWLGLEKFIFKRFAGGFGRGVVVGACFLQKRSAFLRPLTKCVCVPCAFCNPPRGCRLLLRLRGAMGNDCQTLAACFPHASRALSLGQGDALLLQMLVQQRSYQGKEEAPAVPCLGWCRNLGRRHRSHPS